MSQRACEPVCVGCNGKRRHHQHSTPFKSTHLLPRIGWLNALEPLAWRKTGLIQGRIRADWPGAERARHRVDQQPAHLGVSRSLLDDTGHQVQRHTSCRRPRDGRRREGGREGEKREGGREGGNEGARDGASEKGQEKVKDGGSKGEESLMQGCNVSIAARPAN